MWSSILPGLAEFFTKAFVCSWVVGEFWFICPYSRLCFFNIESEVVLLREKQQAVWQQKGRNIWVCPAAGFEDRRDCDSGTQLSEQVEARKQVFLKHLWRDCGPVVTLTLVQWSWSHWCKKTHVHCSKPLCLWLLVSALHPSGLPSVKWGEKKAHTLSYVHLLFLLYLPAKTAGWVLDRNGDSNNFWLLCEMTWEFFLFHHEIRYSVLG